MKVAIFSTKPYDRQFLDQLNAKYGHELVYLEPRLDTDTAALAAGYEAVCVFVNDTLNSPVLTQLASGDTRLITLRCTGFNNVDLTAAEKLGMTVARVPAYSPHAVAEHTIGLMLALNRGIHRAYNRVREGNFSLHGLLGFDMHGRTAGIIGTGCIGRIVAQLLLAFGCRVLAYDITPDKELESSGVEYASLETLYRESDIISLHCPLSCDTHHLIDVDALNMMKDSVMLINTSRGAVVDTRTVIDALKSGRIGYLGLDVYEQEGDLFFENLSDQVIQDDVFERLLTFPNVLVTGHQGYFTREALHNIADTTLGNISAFEQGKKSGNELVASDVTRPPC